MSVLSKGHRRVESSSTQRWTTRLVIAASLAAFLPALAATTPIRASTVLHVLPPLASEASGDPARADLSLTEQITVHVCRLTGSGCHPVTTLSSASAGRERLHLADTTHRTSWLPADYQGQAGDSYRITFRVAGLAIGGLEEHVVANNGAASPGEITLHQPVHVRFRVDRDPIVRTRALHQLGRSATQIARELKVEFALGDVGAARTLHGDARGQDIVLPATTMPAPFSAREVMQAVTSAGTYGVPALRAAQLLVGLFTNQEIADALVNDPNLDLSSSDLLDVVADALGLTSTQSCDLLRQAGVTAKNALTALLGSSSPPTTTFAALQTLAACGYNAEQSLAALRDVVPSVTPIDAARGIVQVLALPIGDVRSAMSTVYTNGDAGTALALLRQAVLQLVAQDCAAYALGSAAELLAQLLVRGGLTPSQVTELLAAAPPSGCEFTALKIGRVLATNQYNTSAADFVAVMAGHTPRFTANGPEGVVAALKSLYGTLPGPATGLLSASSYPLLEVAEVLRDQYFSSQTLYPQSIDIAGALKSWQPAGLPVHDVLFALGKTLQPPPGSPAVARECAASVGATQGGGFTLEGVLSTLDDPSVIPELPVLFPNPYSLGATGNLIELAKCLATNTVAIPFPLLKAQVEYTQVKWGWTFPNVHEGVLTGRIGLDLVNSDLTDLNVPGPALPVQGLATLPVMAFGPAFMHRCEGTIGIPPPSDDPIEWWHCNEEWHDLSTFGDDRTSAFTTTAGIGTFSMIIPALPVPAKIKLAGDYYSAPSLSCADEDANPALTAAAVALPGATYTALPNGKNDLLSTGQTTINLDKMGTSGVMGFQLDMAAQGTGCFGRWSPDASLRGTVSITPAGTEDLLPTVVNVAGAAVNGLDYSLENINGISDLSKIQTPDGNFLSLLVRSGAAERVPRGTELVALLQNGGCAFC